MSVRLVLLTLYMQKPVGFCYFRNYVRTVEEAGQATLLDVAATTTIKRGTTAKRLVEYVESWGHIDVTEAPNYLPDEIHVQVLRYKKARSLGNWEPANSLMQQ